MRKQYTIIDHTADIGITCTGETKEAVFEAAAEGMFSILTNLGSICIRERHTVETRASSYEDLIICWLQELLYLFSTKHFVYSEFSTYIEQTGNNNLVIRGTCGGERVDPEKHQIYTEIKSVTYHLLSVKQSQTLWEAKVIFDI